VFRAEAGRLRPPESIAAAAPPPRPTGAVELPPEEDDDLDLAIPPGHVFPAQRNADILRTLSWAGVWMRIVAAADVLSVFIVMAVISVAHHRRGEDVIGGILCGLILVAPAAVSLWVVGGGLMEVRLHGGSQQVGLLASLASGVFAGILTLFALLTTLGGRGAGSLEYVAIVIMGTMALATAFVTGVGVVARRQAIAAGVAERLSDMDVSNDAEPGVPPALLPYRSPQKIVRSAARTLRLASMILVIWYPLNCCCCAEGGRPDLPHESVYWIMAIMAAGLIPLALMLGAAYYLEEQRRRGIVIAGSIAAVVVSVGFCIYFLVSLLQLTRPQMQEHVPVLLLSSALALTVALSSLIGGVQCWQAVHDPDVRRVFARNR
jgi:hypothetical protein